ncbi:MAG: LuxR family transcriptional regulator [Pseudomonadota bacterium]
MQNLPDHLEHVISARSMQSLWDMHCAAMAQFGFTRLFFGMAIGRSRTSLGSRDDFLLLCTYHPEYIDAFINEGLYLHAPMVRWASTHYGATSWAWLHDSYDRLSPEEQRVVDFNKTFDLTAGYTVSFTEAGARGTAGIALLPDAGVTQAEADAIWARHSREILLINRVMYLKVLTLPFPNARKPLTNRQREALEWVGEGKTTQDISVIMGLTPATVEKHLRLARRALDVETTAQAVLKASLQNQIFRISA